MLWIATTILAFAPQGSTVRGGSGRLVLPPTQRPGAVAEPSPSQQQPVTRDGIQRRFHERATGLRRSRILKSVREQEIVRRIGLDFEDAADRALRLARTSDPDLLHGLVKILDAFGQPEHAKELGFLLQTQPFGKATRGAVGAMARIGRDQARALLFECLVAQRAAVRRHAAGELATRVGPEDLPRLLTLMNQSEIAMRARAAMLVGSIRDDRAVAGLIDVLRDKPIVAEAACRALAMQGEAAIEAVAAILRRPAIGRSFGFAAVAIALLEESVGRPLVDDAMRAGLLGELDMPDRFMQSAVAIALAGMAWNSDDTSGSTYQDRVVVDRLVAVVAPLEFVPHVNLMQDLARRRLVMFSGKDFGLQHRRWREWWADVDAGDGYVAARRHLAVTVNNATLADLRWTDGGRVVRLRGEDVAPLAGLGPSARVADLDPLGPLEYLVAGDELVVLVQKLERAGFMRRGRGGQRAVQATGKTLRLSVGAARCQTDPLLAGRAIDALGSIVLSAGEVRSWQLYRDPTREPDAAAFWRSERRWRDAHPAADARHERLVERIVARMSSLKGPRLDLALQHLASVPAVRDRIDADRARALLAVIEQRPAWDQRAAHLADLVLAAGDAAPWRELLVLAHSRSGENRAEVLSSVFHLLGPDRVIDSMLAGELDVRIAAIDEAIQLRDARSISILIELLDDPQLAIRSTSAFALGQLRARNGRDPLIELLAKGGQSVRPALRRVVWVALARIGGAEVFPILNAAFYSPVDKDRRAVLQAFAELRDPGAARELGNVFALRGPNDELGVLALRLLRGLGDELGAPALRPHIENKNPEVQREVALALGEFGDPVALPALSQLLNDPRYGTSATALVAGITGVDVTAENQRTAVMQRWWQLHGSRGQEYWLLGALANYDVRHRLRVISLVRGAGSGQVPELTRLLLEVEVAHLRPLIARILRQVTGEDFGIVSVQTSPERLQAIADRYRFLVDSDKAASGR